MRFQVHQESFKRLRELVHALPLTEGEKEGPLTNALAAVHAEQVRRAFDSEGLSADQPWAPWSAKYAAWRQKNNLGDLMLRLTDTLYEKATYPSHPNFIRMFVAPNTYMFGFHDQIGSWHVTGTDNMPQRSFMAKTEADVKDFLTAFFEFWRARTLAIVRSGGKL